MLKVGIARSMEAVMMFESEMRQGEHTAVRRPAAVLMSRLTRLLRQESHLQNRVARVR